MNMMIKSSIAAVAVALAAPASAATFELGTFSGDFSTDFGNDSAVGGAFNDFFNFTTTDGGVGGSVISVASIDDIDITSVTLDGVLFDEFSDGFAEIWTLDLTQISAGLHTINVVGTWDPQTGGSYGGQIDFAAAPAVPEPATWAMMIAGFGIAGFAMRRRRETVRVTYA